MKFKGLDWFQPFFFVSILDLHQFCTKTFFEMVLFIFKKKYTNLSIESPSRSKRELCMPSLLLHVTEYEPDSKLILRDETVAVEQRETHVDISMYNNGNESPTLLVKILRSDCDKPAPITSPGLHGFSFPNYGTCAQMTIPASWTEAWFTILHYQMVWTYLAITREDPDIAHVTDFAKAMHADDCVEVWRVLSRRQNVSVYKGFMAV